MVHKIFCKRNIYSFVLCALVVIYYTVIISFSVVPAKQSAAESQKYVDALEKIVIKGNVEGNTDGFSAITRSAVHKLVRKTAHMINFSILGFLLSMMFFEGYRARHVKCFFSILFLGVFCSAADELTQLFIKGRAARLGDVVWDMSGIMFGMVCFFILLLKYTECKEGV